MTMFALLFYSCEQNMNIEIKANDRRLLVDGEFTTEPVIHAIKLYCSGSLITGQSQSVVTGAKICVTDGLDTFEYIENKDTRGLYQTAAKGGGKGGHLYTLSITNIDIDNDGKMDSFTALSVMPVPVTFDSLVSKTGLDGDGTMAVNNYAFYKLYDNGPGYVYPFTLVNNYIRYGTITDRLGSGEFARFESQYKVANVLSPDQTKKFSAYFSIKSSDVKNGDTINFICYNLANDQYGFLKIFDNNTAGNSQFNSKNIYDQLTVPTNLPTNIEPADKAAGYFFVYSVSKISKVFNP